jgi:hypothetical protein
MLAMIMPLGFCEDIVMDERPLPARAPGRKPWTNTSAELARVKNVALSGTFAAAELAIRDGEVGEVGRSDPEDVGTVGCESFAGEGGGDYAGHLEDFDAAEAFVWCWVCGWRVGLARCELPDDYWRIRDSTGLRKGVPLRERAKCGDGETSFDGGCFKLDCFPLQRL